VTTLQPQLLLRCPLKQSHLPAKHSQYYTQHVFQFCVQHKVINLLSLFCYTDECLQTDLTIHYALFMCNYKCRKSLKSDMTLLPVINHQTHYI
jgi:hypothetical protein